MSVVPSSLYFRKLRMLYCSELQLISFFPELPVRGQALRMTLPILIASSRERRDCLETLAAFHGISSAGDDCQSMRKLIDASRSSLAGEALRYPGDDLVLDVCESIHRLLILNYGVARSLAAKARFSLDVEQLDQVLDELIERFPHACDAPFSGQIVRREDLIFH